MSPTIRTVVVEDEPLARDRLCRLLRRAPDVELVGTCADGASAVTAIPQLQPDLLLLDVQLPERDGFSVLEAIGAAAVPTVVLVTAFGEHAVRAFAVDAVDYLVKPFDGPRLDQALERVRRRLPPPPAGRPVDARLPVRTGEQILFVELDDVDYLQAEANYVAVHARGQVHLMRATLTSLSSRLDPRRFVRIHRSFVVRLDRIRAIEPLFHGEYALRLHDGTQLRSARRYRRSLLAALHL